MNKRILLTGGCGYLGSNFVKYWKEKYLEDYIRNIDALTYAGKLSNLAPGHHLDFTLGAPSQYWFSSELSGVTTFEGRIEEMEPLNSLLEFNDNDVIIGFAAETHVDNSLQNSYPFMKTNFIGTHNLLELIRKHCPKTPYIHISTDEVLKHQAPSYCDHDEMNFSLARATEDRELEPKNPYSASKAAAEMLCQAYRANFDMDITIVRPTNLIGPENQHPEKFIPKAITNLLSGKKVPLYGEGEEARDWLYVKDACKALDLLINLEKRDSVYHVAPNNETSNKVILKKVLDRLDISWEDGVELVENRLGHDPWYALDSSKIRSLGWAPTPLEEVLDLTVNYYKDKLSGK